MRRFAQIKRVKKSSLPLIRSNRVCCARSMGCRGVFKDRFVSAFGVNSIFERIQIYKKMNNKRVLFHTEVVKAENIEQDLLVLKKIIYSINIPLFHYEKMFSQYHQMNNSVCDWNLMKRVLNKTFRCAFKDHIRAFNSCLGHVIIKNQISYLNPDEVEGNESDVGKKSSEGRRMAYEYEFILKRNYRITPKV